MMPKMTVLTIATFVLALLIAGPVAADNPCHYLQVWLAAGPDYRFKSISCEEGSYERTSPDKYMLHQKDKRIECNVIIRRLFHNGSVDELNEVRVTQNRCVLKAGNIHVRQVSGRPPIYESHEGSFRPGGYGEVWIKGFTENPPPPDWMPDLPK